MTSNSLLDNIELTIPADTYDYDYLEKILLSCKNVKEDTFLGIIATSNPELKPSITFVQKKTLDPSFLFQGAGLEKRIFYVGKLPIGFNKNVALTNLKPAQKPTIETKKDNVGEYLQVTWPFASYPQLSFHQLFNRIKNSVESLDHVGIHIHPRLVSNTTYKELKRIISQSSCLYDFPTGKEWPFIIPASIDEQKKEPKQGIKRDPKCEFVYNFTYLYPEIQIDIQTRLSPKETIALFPKPYGYYDPDPKNGDYCVSVFMYTGWRNVSLRVDLRFFIPGFSSSDWLIKNGKRVLNPTG